MWGRTRGALLFLGLLLSGKGRAMGHGHILSPGMGMSQVLVAPEEELLTDPCYRQELGNQSGDLLRERPGTVNMGLQQW